MSHLGLFSLQRERERDTLVFVMGCWLPSENTFILEFSIVNTFRKITIFVNNHMRKFLFPIMTRYRLQYWWYCISCPLTECIFFENYLACQFLIANSFIKALLFLILRFFWMTFCFSWVPCPWSILSYLWCYIVIFFSWIFSLCFFI